MTTHFLKDILRQPEELRRTIDLLAGPTGAGRGVLEAATAAVRGARHVYLTGIGSSWHAALNVNTLFHPKSKKMKQAGELPSTVLFYRPEDGRNHEKARQSSGARGRNRSGAHVYIAARESQSHAGGNQATGS